MYLDETFFDELQTKFKAKGGNVAEAYVIAHEVRHDVQAQSGIMAKYEKSLSVDAAADDKASVKLELQTDCFAGVWANSVSKEGVIQPGKINQALDVAAAVGDDRIQETQLGKINPETWTHGSSVQRVDWFNCGYTSGEPGTCDTFASAQS